MGMLECQKKPPANPMNHYEAVEYPKTLGEGWRLATIEELVKAYKNKVPGFLALNYWSSSTLVDSTNHAWSVDFSDGVTSYNFKTNDYYVRCVREKSSGITVTDEELEKLENIVQYSADLDLELEIKNAVLHALNQIRVKHSKEERLKMISSHPFFIFNREGKTPPKKFYRTEEEARRVAIIMMEDYPDSVFTVCNTLESFEYIKKK